MISTSYVQALRNALPAQYLSGLQDLPTPTLHLLDAVLRFASGGECPEDADSETKESWRVGQEVVRKAFDAIALKHPATNGGTKRTRDEEVDSDGHAAKKSKTSSSGSASPGVISHHEDDPPLYTLHALSLQAPLRKKLDIVIHQHTLRLINPSTQAVEASIPSSSLKRAFLLNTRGKTKAHWTVVILASDTVAPKVTGKAAQAAAAAAAANGEVKAEERQIVFGIDAAPPAYAVTDHASAEVSRASHPKGTPILPQLRAFLAHLPITYVEPDNNVFRSAASGSGGEPIAGVEAYRAAKEGTLWFFNDGILWDGRPCEYWSLTDLVPGSADDEISGEAVRFVSATGKTGSIFIRRREPKVTNTREPADGDAENEDEDEEYMETAFNPVDAKEQDGIARWVKKHKRLFGVDPSQTNGEALTDAVAAEGSDAKVDLKGKGKAVALPEEDSDDSDDEDFVDESDDDGGSASSEDSDESDDDDEDGSEAEESDAEGGDADEGEDEEEEDLDPKHHPLLRAGAMPRMSKAAMDMAIGMATADMVGAGSSTAGGSRAKAVSVESEEDELDD